MKIFLLFALILISQTSFSQQPVDELGVAYSKITNFNFLPGTPKKSGDLSYAEVIGSAFWNNDWNAAIFVLSNGTFAKTQKAKLNLYSNEVHFISSDNVELSCETDQIKKIYFFKGIDTSKVIAVFESLPDPSSNTNAYYKVLNGGKLRLLKSLKVLVKENEYNPALGKKEYSFYTKINYAIGRNEIVIPIKTLNESNVFSAIALLPEFQDWLKQNNNKLRSESEITTFFNYLNTKDKISPGFISVFH